VSGGVEFIGSGELPDRELVGADHGDVGISLIMVDAEPGKGPSLHRHEYAEVFIVLEGESTFFTDEEEIQAGPGDILIAHAGQPHGFVNSGDGRLRQIDIHVSQRFVTEWLASSRETSGA